MRTSLLLCLLLSASHGVLAQVAAPVLAIGTRHVLPSTVLAEDREVLVYVPESYTDSSFSVASYPVLYVLDGDAHFHSATGLLRFLSEAVNGVVAVPEHIVVAIPNTDRMRDLTPSQSVIDYFDVPNPRYEASGGGDAFLDFLERELVPFIDTAYRTLPYRTFVGHSLGGLEVLHAFVHREGLFQAHIAIDPSLWWDNGRLVNELETKVASGWNPRGIVYVSNAGIPLLVDGVDRMQLRAGQFVAAVEHLEGPQFRIRHEVFPNEYHASVALLSLYQGLYHVFDGYRLIETDFMAGPEHVQRRMAAFRRRSDLSLAVNPETIEWSARWMISVDRLRETGLGLLELNVAQFPDSPRTHRSLASGLLTVGDTTRAIAHLRRALELKEDPRSRQLIDSLLKE